MTKHVFGHLGDALKECAARGDKFRVYKVGGDKFAIALSPHDALARWAEDSKVVCEIVNPRTIAPSRLVDIQTFVSQLPDDQRRQLLEALDGRD